MPRYYFHLHDGSTRNVDREGMVLPDEEAAWYQAVRSARELIGNGWGPFSTQPSHCVEIEDEHGRPIEAVRLEELLRLAS